MALLPSGAMYAVLTSVLAGVFSAFRARASLQFEILALRHQLAILQRTKKRRVPLRAEDRLLWVAVYRLWPEWRKALVLVKPDTVIGWHRKGLRFYWRWKRRRGQTGRPGTSQEIRTLIREMSSRNVLYVERAFMLS